MRVPAGLDAGEIADVENDPARHRLRRDKLWRPGVVADPVDDHQLCARNGSRVGGRRLVVVGVGGGARDHARDVNPAATDLRGDAAPEVLRRDHLQTLGSGRRRATLCLAAAAANERQRCEQGGDRDWWHTLTILILDTACNREPLSLAAL